MPHSAIVTSMNPDEYRQSLRDQVKLVVTARGEFRGAVTRVDLHRVQLRCYQESLPRIFHTIASSSRIGIVYPASAQQAPMHHTGMEVLPGHIVFRSLGTEHHFRSSEACRWGAVSFAPEDLVAAGQAIADRDLTPPKTNQLIRPSPVLMDRLLHLHAAANNLAATAPDILARPEVAKAIEQALTSAVVGCLADDNSQRTVARHKRVSVMRRFAQIVEANAGKPLYLAEVCTAIGVSTRTLQACCWDHLGMPPHRYLLLRRMALVRRSLALANPATQTVTEIATEYGFWELGRFSVAFRKLFGESPSVTLRRTADAGRVPLQAC